MSSDPETLRTEQYATGANLSARIALHARFRTAPIPWHRWLFDRMEIPGSARILDVGCGTGLLWRALAELLPPDCLVVLTDFSEGMLREARTAADGLHALPVAVDAGALAFANDSADIVVAFHMLYHVPDRERTFREVRRVLRDDGRFFATTVSDRYLHQLDGVLDGAVEGRPSIRATLERFSAENGLEQLRAWFSHVEMEGYEDRLEVTDAEAIGDYLQSIGTGSGLTDEDVERVVEEVRGEIERAGSFALDAPAVLFTCHG